ncbi:MAG: erythromycin esterase family protein [Chlorobi bacterium]|nr:erythromycin esterase family protein [Chlorobiota bacterium]
MIENTHRLNSISPSCTNNSDLQFLKEKIKDADLVLLGEAGHLDGSTFEAKTRIIKFLNQQMGFEVLVFESGLYDCFKAWNLYEQGVGYDSAFGRGVFPVWSTSRQLDYLKTYIARSIETGHRMELAGCDIQFTGSIGPQKRGDEFNEDLQRLFPDVSIPEYSMLVDIISDNNKYFRHVSINDFDTVSRKIVKSQLQSLIKKLEDVKPKSLRQLFFLRYLKNIDKNLYFKWNLDFNNLDAEVANSRDREMARNLIWLKDTVYKHKKLIVWGATSHLISNRSFLQNEDKMISMGSYIKKHYGQRCYIIGFSSFDGILGSISRNESYRVPMASNKSIEYLLNQSGIQYGFLDKRAFACMGDIFIARFLGYSNYSAKWNEMLDAMLFINEMKPNTAKDETK